MIKCSNGSKNTCYMRNIALHAVLILLVNSRCFDSFVVGTISGLSILGYYSITVGFLRCVICGGLFMVGQWMGTV